MSENYTLNADPGPDGGLVNRVTLTCNGAVFSDWRAISITRSMEAPTPFFEFLATNIDDEDAAYLVPGAACTVNYGNDRLLTGYVDGVSRSISALQNQIRVYGRGECQDLIDSSFLFEDSGILVADLQNTTIEKIARRLATYYGIEVETKIRPDPTNMDGRLFAIDIPYVQASEGHSVYDILEPLSLWSGVLLYENAMGNLVLATPAWGQHGGGDGSTGAAIEVGHNVLAATSDFSVRNRFRNYFYTYRPTAEGLINGRSFFDGLSTTTVIDDGVSADRNRSLVIVEPLASVPHDPTVDTTLFGEARTRWERNRRWGRSKVIRMRVDSWTDASGAPWEPNWLCPVHAPEIGCSSVAEYTLGVKQSSLASTILGTRTIARSGVVNWVISDVTYNLSMEGGTTADITLMPTEAFILQPSILYSNLDSVLAFGAGGNVPAN